MEKDHTYIDLTECFDGGYDSYSDIDFKEWENGDLRITRHNNKSHCNEEILVKQEEYLSWLAYKGRKLKICRWKQRLMRGFLSTKTRLTVLEINRTERYLQIS